jgi:hypothetical protein
VYKTFLKIMISIGIVCFSGQIQAADKQSQNARPTKIFAHGVNLQGGSFGKALRTGASAPSAPQKPRHLLEALATDDPAAYEVVQRLLNQERQISAKNTSNTAPYHE